MAKTLVSLQDLHKFDQLDILARQVVEGFIIGLHKSPFHGFSVEFAEHRLYNPGDPIKNVDWKVYGRTDRMFIKKFEEETNLRCRIILDASSSMYFPADAGKADQPPLNKLHFSAYSAAVLMYMLKKQRDAVGLTIFSDEVEFHTKSKSTTVHHNLLKANIHKVLERKIVKKDRRKTAAAKCLHEIAENIRKRSLVIIFSDMFENHENVNEVFSGLQHLKHNKHEVVVFHVVDRKKELDFEFENRPYIFVDMETGQEEKVKPSQVKQYYKKQMEQFTQNLKLKCLQYKIDFEILDINAAKEDDGKGWWKMLHAYLVKRSKMKT